MSSEPPPPPSGSWQPPSSVPPPPAPPPPPPPPFGQATYGQPPFGQAPFGAPGAPAHAYANFGQRLVATIIDGLVGLLFAIPFGVLLAVSFAAGSDGLCRGFDEDEIVVCRQANGGILALAFLAGAVGMVAYYVFMCRRLGRTGQTPGRKAMGIKVVDGTTGQPIGAGRAFGRYLFAGFISGSICWLGYLWMLWEGQKRTWHDLVVGTVVVKA